MFGDLSRIMKIAGQMKARIPEIKEKLAASQYSADSGGSAVTATVNGKLALVDLKIDRGVLEDGRLLNDPEMLEDLIKAAVSAAQQKAATATVEAMKELTGGMNLPGLSDMMQ